MSDRATILTADHIELQLCESRAAPFTAPGWVFELKLDGFRLLAERRGGRVRLLFRRGRTATEVFPEVVAAVKAVPGDSDFILDGEVVIQDAEGRPIFQRLLKRSTLTSPRDIERARRADPAVYFAFDLLMLDGEDLRRRPLSERKALLMTLLQSKPPGLLPVDFIEQQGDRLYDLVTERGLEGIVAKRLDSPYRGGRTAEWIKIAHKHTADFAVVGYADDWGALYFATFDGQHFVFAGKVGSGFTPKIAEALRPELEAHRVRRAPCIGDVPREKEAVWCEPTVVIEVRYKNWPEGLAPREPTFLRVREDKSVRECPTPRGRSPLHEPSATLAGPDLADAPRAKGVSNPRKLYFPDDGISKGDVVEYYRAVARWMVPYLRDRPLVMVRYPDGIHGKSFFQKQKPAQAPSFVRSVLAFSEEQNRDIDQIACDDAQTLEWCANLGGIVFHVGAARIAAPERPDWCVLDFDPKEAPFAHVVSLATTLHALCVEAGLPVFVKTSGSSGLHALIPLGGQLDSPGALQLAELLANLLLAIHPTLATMERSIRKREGRVYLDVGQNGSGRLVAAPLSLRAHPTAPVSMPLRWEEVGPHLAARQFTLREAVRRLEVQGDPMAPVLTSSPNLVEVVPRLAALRPR